MPNSNSQKGAVPLFLLVAAITLVGFLVVLGNSPIKDKLLSTISPKPDSHAATPTGVVELAVTPAQVSAAPNSTFSVDVVMETNSTNVSAAQIQVNFDPSLLKATSIAAGNFLPTTLTAGAVGQGTATITVGAQPGTVTTGSGKVATVSFTTLGTATSSTQISLDQINTQVAVIGATGDQAGLLSPSIVTIALPSPSITPTPTPTTVPTATPAPSPSSVPSISPSSKVSFEAESMTLPGTNAVQVFSDSLASGGSALVFFSNSLVNKSFTSTAASSQIVVRARGEQCKGNPGMEIRVDNVKVSRKALGIAGTVWTDYIINFSVQPGIHNLSLAFVNDYSRVNCDKNLRVDRVELR